MQRTQILAFLSHQEDCGKNDKSLECPEVIETGSDLQLWECGREAKSEGIIGSLLLAL